MKMLSLAALAATALATGMVAGAVPAAAATCGCPVVHHHPARRAIRHRVVYRREPAVPPVADATYDEPPAAPVYEDDAAYDAPPVIYEEPAYYGAPIWFGGYYGGPYGYGGWGHGYRGWGGGYHGGGRGGYGGGFHGGGFHGGGHRR